MNMRIIICILLLASCSPLRHYKKVATDPNVTPEKKAVIAPWVVLNFPFQPTYSKPDTVDILIVDTIQLYSTDTLHDVKNLVQFRDRIVTKVVQRTIRDTVKFESTATIDAIRRQLSIANERNGQVHTQKEQAEAATKAAKSKNRNLIYILIALGAMLLTSIYLHIKRGVV
jgi:hypothetical protein